MPTQKIIFFRTPWMNHYKGITKDDIPQNGGSWVKENNDAHEAYNFTNCGRYYYGFAQPNRLDLSRIENTKEEFIDNTLVIFFSTKPGEGGQYIIGWYKNATVYKFHQEIFHKNRKPKYKWYHAKAKTGNGYLVPSTDRLFELPVRPGENNVWYGKEYLSKTQLEKILKYIQDPVGYFKKSVKTLKKPRQYDIEKRLKVEHAAMDAVWEHYSYLEYTLTDVSGKK